MIERILTVINDWNPIEIYPLLKEEYQHEIEKIHARIKGDSRSIEHVSDVIYSVFKESFGEQFSQSKKECERIAEKLI